MFCTKCGSQIPEGGSCPNCNPVAQVPPVETQVPSVDTPITPVESQAQSVCMAQTGVKLRKGQYISQLAPTSVKTFSLVGLIATCLAIVFFIGCYFSFINTSFEDIPVIKMTEVDIEEAKDGMDEAANKLDDLLDEAKDEGFEDDYIDAVDEAKEAVEKLSDSFSIGNIRAFLKTAREFNDVCDDYEEYGDEKIDLDEMDALEMVLNYISYGAIGFVVFCAIFTLLGGFLKKNGLVIPGMLFTLFYTLVLCGALFVALGLILHVAMIVSNAIVNSSYKKYKKSF